jgi:hypothetical protein
VDVVELEAGELVMVVVVGGEKLGRFVGSSGWYCLWLGLEACIA